MSNQALYDKFKNYPGKYEANPFSQPYYSSSLKEYYGDLLPITEIDTIFEKMVLEEIHDFEHVQFLVLNLNKTSTFFKEEMSAHVHYISLQDVSEKDKIYFLKTVYRSLYACDENYEHGIIDRVASDFSEDSQRIMMDHNVNLIRMIKNYNLESITKAIDSKMVYLYEFLRQTNYPVDQNLMSKISTNIPSWYTEVSQWDSKSISYLIQEFCNLFQTREFELKFAYAKSLDILRNPHKTYRDIVSIMFSILREDKICSIDLYKLSQSPIGRDYLYDLIKNHKKYKDLASMLLEEIEEIKDV